jgi:hypothetical protein
MSDSPAAVPIASSPVALLSALPAAVPARMLYGTKETEMLLSVSHAQLYRLLNVGRLEHF